MTSKRPTIPRTLAEVPYMPKLHVKRTTLCVAVDETGCEDFSQPVFGFGGIAGNSVALACLERSWNRMKDIHFGGRDEPLHASGTSFTSQQIDALNRFFAQRWFFRFAFIFGCPIVQLKGMDAIKLMRGFISEEFLKAFAQLDPLPKDVQFVFESSERLAPKVMAAMPGGTITIEGEPPIPVICGFMDKLPPTAMLEVADFVVNTAQSQVRFGKGKIRKDFLAVFHEAGAPCSFYREMQLAKLAKENGPAIEFNYSDNGTKVSVKISGPGPWRLDGENHLRADPSQT